MEAKISPASKRGQIDKANNKVVIWSALAAFVVIFCAVAGKTLISQATYQNRIINAKKDAVKQLKEDISSAESLKSSYSSFDGADKNVLGGYPNGNGPLDGSNTKIVLDALPSNYDFPALATSLEKLIAANSLNIVSISGNDDEVTQSQNQTSASPTPIAIPFQVTVSGDYSGVQSLMSTFYSSIRPIQVQSLTISGDQSALTMNVSAQTFYQPAKSLKITTKVIK